VLPGSLTALLRKLIIAMAAKHLPAVDPFPLTHVLRICSWPAITQKADCL